MRKIGHYWVVLSYKALFLHCWGEFLSIGEESAVRRWFSKFSQAHHWVWFHQVLRNPWLGIWSAHWTYIKIAWSEDCNAIYCLSNWFWNDKLQSECLSDCIFKLWNKFLVPFQVWSVSFVILHLSLNFQANYIWFYQGFSL